MLFEQVVHIARFLFDIAGTTTNRQSVCRVAFHFRFSPVVVQHYYAQMHKYYAVAAQAKPPPTNDDDDDRSTSTQQQLVMHAYRTGHPHKSQFFSVSDVEPLLLLCDLLVCRTQIRI
jgi:hypothetical protein